MSRLRLSAISLAPLLALAATAPAAIIEGPVTFSNATDFTSNFNPTSGSGNFSVSGGSLNVSATSVAVYKGNSAGTNKPIAGPFIASVDFNFGASASSVAIGFATPGNPFGAARTTEGILSFYGNKNATLGDNIRNFRYAVLNSTGVGPETSSQDSFSSANVGVINSGTLSVQYTPGVNSAELKTLVTATGGATVYQKTYVFNNLVDATGGVSGSGPFFLQSAVNTPEVFIRLGAGTFDNFKISSVPEPSSALFGLAGAGMMMLRKRKR